MSDAIEAAMAAFAYVAHDLTPEQYRKSLAAATSPAAKRAVEKSRAAIRAAITAYLATPEAKPALVGVKPLSQAQKEACGYLTHHVLGGDSFSSEHARIILALLAAYEHRHKADIAALTPGYVLVPVDPTAEMLDAADRADDEAPLSDWGEYVGAGHAGVYRAMLAKVKPHDQ